MITNVLTNIAASFIVYIIPAKISSLDLLFFYNAKINTFY